MLKLRSQLHINCNTCAFSSICLAKNLTDEELEKLNSLIIKVQLLDKGAYLYRQSEKMQNLYAVYSGSVKDCYVDEEGNEFIYNFYYPGDILALESIPQKQYSFSCVALSPVQVCVVPVDGLIELMQVSPNLLKRFIELESYRIQDDRNIHATTNAKRRVADFLIHTLSKLEERKLAKGHIPLTMSQFDISNLLGMAYETLSRVLHEFQRKHIIKIFNKDIQILDVKALQKQTPG